MKFQKQAKKSLFEQVTFGGKRTKTSFKESTAGKGDWKCEGLGQESAQPVEGQ